MIDFKKFDHLGFIRPVPKRTTRTQVPTEFFEFVKAYEKSGNRHATVKGSDLLAVMAVLRSKPPGHCWRGKAVIEAMRNCGTGECKTKAVMSCLNMAGWIRYLNVVNAGKPTGAVTEVMYYQLPQAEAGHDRLIRLDRNGKPAIFRREGLRWIAVADEDYPSDYVCDHDSSSSLRSTGNEAEAVVWVPSEWGPSERASSERASSERDAPPQYREDEIEENQIENRPCIPLSEKGDLGFASPGKEEESGADDVPSPAATSVADNRLSAPGAATAHSRSVSDLVMLGRRSLNSPADRLTYEEFVVDQLLPQHLADPTPPLTKWHADKGIQWLAASFVAQVILSLFTDGRWPPDVGRSFYKRARNLSPVDLKKILLGYDWGRYEADSVTSLFGSTAGTSKAEGWDRFIEKTRAEFRSWREEISQRVESLNLVCENDFGFDYWLKFGSHGSVERVDDESPSDLKFWWLYFTGLHKQAAFPAGVMDPVRTKFERNRTAWCSEMAQLCAESRLHLSVVIELHVITHRVWGIDLNQVRQVHQEWMDRFHRRARIYEVKVEKTFTSMFDFNSSVTDADEGTLASSANSPLAATTSGPISPPGLTQSHAPSLTPFPAPVEVPSQAKGSEDLDGARDCHSSAGDLMAQLKSVLRGS